MTKKVKTAEQKVQQVQEYDLSGCETTSSKIRKLTELGMSRGQVAKHLNIRYQHVRNVLITPIKKQK